MTPQPSSMAGARPGIAAVPVDLLAVAILLAGCLLGWSMDVAWLRAAMAVPLILYAVGHVMLVALFPTRRTHGGSGAPTGLERIALGFVLSFVISGAIGLLLSVTAQGITEAAFALTFFPLLGLLVVVAAVRWWQVPRDLRLALPLPSGPRESGMEKLLLAACIVSAVGLAGAGYLVLDGPPRESFTEFFLEGADGRSRCYPEVHNATGYHPSARDAKGCPPSIANVTLGILNREDEPRTYWIRILWEGDGPNATVAEMVVDTLTARVDPVRIDVDPGRVDHATRIGFELPPPPFPGSQTLAFQLYRADPSVSADRPYRSLEITVQATA